MREVRAKASQERPRLDHVGAKMATWCSTWSFWGRFLVDFLSIWGAFWHMDRIVKLMKNLVFFEVFRYSGGLGWLVEASLAPF